MIKVDGKVCTQGNRYSPWTLYIKNHQADVDSKYFDNLVKLVEIKQAILDVELAFSSESVLHGVI